MAFSGSFSGVRSSQDRFSISRSMTNTTDAAQRCRHCSRLIAPEEMEEHELYFCPLKTVRCQHTKANGDVCGFVCSGMEALQDHYKTCKDYPRKRRSVSIPIREGGSPRGAPERAVEICEDCQSVFPDRAELADHQLICPLKSVPCPLHCGQWMARGQVPSHILNTAEKHKPLRRPSVSDYGGDNIHMVVAVLMEALQNLKKARRKSPSEETGGNLTPSESISRPSPRRATVSGEDGVSSPKSQASESMRIVGPLDPQALAPGVAISTSLSLSSKDVEDPTSATAAATKKAQRSASRRKRKTATGTKAHKSPHREVPAVPAPPPLSTRATPGVAALTAAVNTPPAALRYQDFVVASPARGVRAKSPPHSTRLRPTRSKVGLSARPKSGLSPRQKAGLSPRSHRSVAGAMLSPRAQVLSGSIVLSPRISSIAVPE